VSWERGGTGRKRRTRKKRFEVKKNRSSGMGVVEPEKEIDPRSKKTTRRGGVK